MSVQIVSPEKAVEVLTIELECKKEKIEELRVRIATLEAENARLTAAHAMQGEELVTLPRHMVYSMEDKLKEQAAEIARLTEKVRYAYVQIEALEAK